MSYRTLVSHASYIATPAEDNDPNKWNIEEYCQRRELTKLFLRTQLRKMERTYHERLSELTTHEAPFEYERRKIIAFRKFDKKTGRPKWYLWWEMFYMLWIWFSIMMSFFYLGFGITIQSWTPSIQSIAINETTYVPVSIQDFQFVDELRYYDMLEYLSYNCKRTSAYFFFMSNYLFFFSCVTLYHAGWLAEWQWLIAGAIHQSIVLGTEIFVVDKAFKTMPKVCRSTVFRNVLFHRYYRWYGILSVHKDSRGAEAIEKIHAMQGAMGCCGIDSYMDFYNILATQNDSGFNRSWWPDQIGVRRLLEQFNDTYYYSMGRDVRQVPFSCCKPIWRNDFYCGDNIFYYDNNFLLGTNVSLARERLNSRGCVEVVLETCNAFRFLATYGLLYAVIFRIVIYILILIFSPLVHRSTPWRMKWLWYLTEGIDGRKYLKFAKKKKDIMFLALRQPHDRFNPNVFRWCDPDFINLEVPRDGVPLKHLLKLDDLPSEAEFKRLRQIAESSTLDETSATRRGDRSSTKPSDAYKRKQSAFLKLDSRGKRIGEKLSRQRAIAEAQAQSRAEFPGNVLNPKFRFYPARKTIHFKERKKFNVLPQRQPIPPDISEWDRETLRRQAKVHVDTRFDWAGAIENVKREEQQKQLLIEKTREQRAIRNALIKGFDIEEPWLPIKREVEEIEREHIAADEDDKPPPAWYPRPIKEGGGGFLQPMQIYEIARKKALEAGEDEPVPPDFSSKLELPRKLTTNKLADWMWDTFPDMKKSHEDEFRPSRTTETSTGIEGSERNAPDRMSTVVNATAEKAQITLEMAIKSQRRQALHKSLPDLPKPRELPPQDKETSAHTEVHGEKLKLELPQSKVKKVQPPSLGQAEIKPSPSTKPNIEKVRTGKPAPQPKVEGQPPIKKAVGKKKISIKRTKKIQTIRAPLPIKSSSEKLLSPVRHIKKMESKKVPIRGALAEYLLPIKKRVKKVGHGSPERVKKVAREPPGVKKVAHELPESVSQPKATSEDEKRQASKPKKKIGKKKKKKKKKVAKKREPEHVSDSGGGEQPPVSASVGKKKVVKVKVAPARSVHSIPGPLHRSKKKVKTAKSDLDEPVEARRRKLVFVSKPVPIGERKPWRY